MAASNSMTLTQTIIAAAVIVVLGFLAYGFLTAPDNRSFTDRMGDAFHALPRGVDKAGEQLEDRTPGQKLGDAVKDQGQKLKDDTAPE